MLNIVVCVSGGGTNLQAILDAMDRGAVTNTRVLAVISNNAGARALERARDRGIEAKVICWPDSWCGFRPRWWRPSAAESSTSIPP